MADNFPDDSSDYQSVVLSRVPDSCASSVSDLEDDPNKTLDDLQGIEQAASINETHLAQTLPQHESAAQFVEGGRVGHEVDDHIDIQEEFDAAQNIPQAIQRESAEFVEIGRVNRNEDVIDIPEEFDVPHHESAAQSVEGHSQDEDDHRSELSGSDIDIPEEISDVESDVEMEDEDEDIEIDLMDANSLKSYKPTWTDSFVNFTVMPFDRNEGPQLPSNFDTVTSTPISYFSLFFNDEIIEHIVDCTNKYAAWKFDQDPNYRDKFWTGNVGSSDIKAFLGISILTGLNPLHSYRDYWSSDIFIGNLGIQTVLSLKKFETLNRYFHVSDRSREPDRNSPDFDKLYKVREIMEKVSVNFRKYSAPSCCQSLDEGMVAFKGRISYLQYMPAKPTKRGMKVFIRCDSDTGYINEFEVYLGKTTCEVSENGAYFDIVKRLTEKILNRYHQIYFDNAYTSVPLLLHLLQHRTYACGTVRANRKGLPHAVNKPDNLDRGDFISRQDWAKPHLTATVWRDTKIVRFLSTLSSPEIETQAIRRVRGVRTQVRQPSCAQRYAKHMGGVDRFDQLRGTHSVGRYSKKAWKYLFFFLLNSAVTNAWILYKKSSKRRIKAYSHFRFRHELAIELFKHFRGRKTGCVTTSSLHGRTHKNVHLGLKRARRCVMHKSYQPDGKQKYETIFGCRSCNLVLCPLCHLRYHQSL